MPVTLLPWIACLLIGVVIGAAGGLSAGHASRQRLDALLTQARQTLADHDAAAQTCQQGLTAYESSRATLLAQIAEQGNQIRILREQGEELRTQATRNLAVATTTAQRFASQAASLGAELRKSRAEAISCAAAADAVRAAARGR